MVWQFGYIFCRIELTSYADYPNPEAKQVQLHLNQGGDKQGRLTIEKPAESQGTEKLSDDVGISGRGLARAESSSNRLMYATPKLKEPLHISGTAKIKIKLAVDRPAANLSVWLVSLPWDISPKTNTNLISRGWADPQNHKSLTESAPLEPGKFYELEFDLEPDDQIIPVGQRGTDLPVFGITFSGRTPRPM